MKSEKGQALPLAMMTLAIGMIIITPFLGHASASVISSRTYGESMNTRSSCDAGIEHAIWRLTRDGLADQLSEPGDHIAYQLPEPINGLNTSVAVTANIIEEEGNGEFSGDIITPEIDSYGFASDGSAPVRIIQVAGSVYAVVYTENDNEGTVKTVNIAADGMITEPVIDSYKFESGEALRPDIVHVSGNYFAIVYREGDGDGGVKTIAIAPNGAITHYVIDYYRFENQSCTNPRIINVSGSTFAIVYQGWGDDGWIRTVRINSNGSISGIGGHSYLEYDTGDGIEPDIVHISGDIFAIAYRSSNQYPRGYVKTISITTGGTVGWNYIDSYRFSDYCSYPDIIAINGEIFAVVYYGYGGVQGGWGGIIDTLRIESDGNIIQGVVGETVFNAWDGRYAKIINIDEDVYAVTYTDNSNDGWIKTLFISDDGSMTGEILDSYEFDGNRGYVPDIIHINENIFAIAYTSEEGWWWWTYEFDMLKTIRITGRIPIGWQITAVAGDISVQAFVGVSGENATIYQWLLE